MLNTSILGKIFAEAIIHVSKNQQSDRLFDSVGKAFGQVVLACTQTKLTLAATQSISAPKVEQWVKSNNEQTYIIHDIKYDVHNDGGQTPLVVRPNIATPLGDIPADVVAKSKALANLLEKKEIVYVTKEDAANLDAKGRQMPLRGTCDACEPINLLATDGGAVKLEGMGAPFDYPERDVASAPILVEINDTDDDLTPSQLLDILSTGAGVIGRKTNSQSEDVRVKRVGEDSVLDFEEVNTVKETLKDATVIKGALNGVPNLEEALKNFKTNRPSKPKKAKKNPKGRKTNAKAK